MKRIRLLKKEMKIYIFIEMEVYSMLTLTGKSVINNSTNEIKSLVYTEAVIGGIL